MVAILFYWLCYSDLLNVYSAEGSENIPDFREEDWDKYFND